MTKKKIYIAIGVAVFIIVAVVSTHYIVRAIQRNSDIVYICTGEYSRAYHCTLNCKGLDNCSADVIAIEKDRLPNRYRHHPCGYCYGKRLE